MPPSTRLVLFVALCAACSSDPPSGATPTTDVGDDQAIVDSAADVTAPDATAPDATAPDVSDAAAPDVTAPDVAAPDVTAPDAAAPDVTTPDVTTPDVTTPDVTAPDVTAPDVTAPDVTAPDVTALDTPDVTAPDVTALDAPLDRADVLDASPDVVDAADVPLDVVACTGPTCPLQAVAGSNFACARFADGTVSCWGNNQFGQIGDGTYGPSVYRERPTPVRGLTDVVDLSAGATHVCARRSDGSVWCWGANGSRQVGSGRSGSWEPNASVAVGVADARQVACGGSHTCALLGDGTVRCWGANTLGQLGDGSTTARPTATLVPGLTGVRAIAAGNNFTCAALGDGTVRCWGEAAGGQLGRRLTDPVNVPTEVPGVAGAVALSAGVTHACALRGDGSAQCWGGNSVYGVLGNPTSSRVDVAAVTVALSSPIRSIQAGARHTCALLRDGAVYCWGSNERGVLGDGRSGLNDVWRTPTRTRDLPPVLGLATGRAFNCAVTVEGAIVCWGAALSGELGNGAVQGFATPQAVPGLRNVVQLEARGLRTCARLADGAVSCWGHKALGTPGWGEYDFGCFAPLPVVGVDAADEVSVGVEHACARLRSGALRCWGFTTYGALGSATAGALPTLTDVTGVRDATALALGYSRSCALLGDGSVRCWGRNYDGDLGIGAADTINHPIADRAVVDVADAIGLGAGRYHACALRRDRTAACWGANAQGQLGDGTAVTRPAPVAVAGLTDVAQVVGGSEHTCARRGDGSVWCWGLNGNGQCGADLAVPRLTAPTRVGAIADARALAAGDEFTCALRADGTVWCWGRNTSSQLAEAPASAGRGTPMAVQGLAGVTAITAGTEHVCALRADGTVWCWGGFNDGQLGLGHLYTVLR